MSIFSGGHTIEGVRLCSLVLGDTCMAATQPWQECLHWRIEEM